MLLHLSLLFASFFPADDWLTFHRIIFDQSPIIVEAEIADANGRLKINTFYRGHLDSSYINLEGLSSPNTLLEPGFAPGSNLVHQKCILFLQERQGRIIPAFTAGSQATQLLMSLVWVMQDSIYYGEQPGSPGEIVFSAHGDHKQFIDYIHFHNKSIHTLFAASGLKYQDKEKAAILKESLAWTLLRDQTIAEIGRCGEEGLKTLYDLLPIDTFLYSDRIVLSTFISVGQEKVFPQVEAVFQRELEYWKLNLDFLDPNYWNRGRFPERYTYLCDLMYLMAENQAPGWREKVVQVRDVFRNSKNYVLPTGYCRIDTSIDEILKGY